MIFQNRLFRIHNRFVSGSAMPSVAAATAALGAAQDALSSTEAALARANTDAESVEEDSPAFTRLMDNSITPLLATMNKRQKAVDKAEKALRFALKKNDDADEAETALRHHHPRPAMASSFVPFSALGMDDAFKLLVVGPRDAEEIVFFQAGFPDDHTSFLPLARRLAQEHGCLCGISVVPEYDRARAVRTEGYDFHEVVAVMNEAVTALLSASANRDAQRAGQVHMVIHDWGSVYVERGESITVVCICV